MRDGHFYPPEAKSAEARLRFYADQFPIVEVDSTYYFPPSEKNAVRWNDRTPKDFTFNIKAYFLPTFWAAASRSGTRGVQELDQAASPEWSVVEHRRA